MTPTDPESEAPLRILIVEDETLIAEEIGERLTKLGFAIAGVADTGEKAIQAAEQTLPGLILMDIRLKGPMDGIQTAEAIRERHPAPVVFLTAHSDQHTLRRAKDAAPFGYVLKPFHQRDLLVAIDMAVYRHDLEQRMKQLEERLRESRKMEAIGRLAGGVAHEFNNLLTVVMGYSEMLMKDDSQNEIAGRWLREIKGAGERGARLTRQLLAFSRNQVLQPSIFNLSDLIADLNRMIQRVVGEDVVLVMALSPALWPVRADSVQIEQVVLNLAVNAHDAMPDGGQLRIETINIELSEDMIRSLPDIKPGRFVLLTVSDNGAGMDQTTRERLFEPFFTTKEQGEGIGLGLATAYGIVNQSGGFIDVYSEPGQGAMFKIYLPAFAKAPGSGAPDAENGAAIGGDETILLVEDEDAVRSMTAFALRQQGYTVLEANGGEEAGRVAQERLPAIRLLITDVIMTGMNGWQVANLIRTLKPGIRVLFLSGYAGDAMVHYEAPEGETTFLQKPFTLTALEKTVRELLDH